MGKKKNRIEKRPQPIVLDEEAIRAAYLSGMRPADIAHRAKSRPLFAATKNFIEENREDWDDERRKLKLVADDHKIVIDRTVTAGKWGGTAWMRVSLPRVTMHVLALQEARHA